MRRFTASWCEGKNFKLPSSVVIWLDAHASKSLIMESGGFGILILSIKNKSIPSRVNPLQDESLSPTVRWK